MNHTATDEPQDGQPLGLSLHDQLGLHDVMLERWRLAVDVAHGRMVGGWVPVDADVVLAIDAALQRKGLV